MCWNLDEEKMSRAAAFITDGCMTGDVMKRRRVSNCRNPAARGRETTPDYRLAILTYKVQSTATPASLHCFLFHVFCLIVWNLLSDIVVNADSLTLF